MSSTLKTFALLAGLTALFIAFGGLIGGRNGMMIALVLAIGMNAFAWWNSADMALSAYGAQEVDQRTAPELVGLVAQLARRAELPMPRVCIIESDQPNAFATGRDPDHGAVAVTTGLLRQLDTEQLAGVIAHELGHIKNRDTLIMTVTATIAGAISTLANFGFLFGGRSEDERDGGGNVLTGILLAVLAPLAAMVVQMAISRTREYEADRIGAAICGNPLWLARALASLHAGAAHIPNPGAEAHPATAHLFIVNPLSGNWIAGLFSTHPPMEERIARLQQLAGSGGLRGGGGSAPGRTGSAPGRSGPWSQPRGPWG